MKLDIVREILKAKELDAILISDGYNMRYITGFSGATGYVYISDKQAVILTDSRYTEAAEKENTGFEVIEISVEKGYYAWLKELAEKDGAVKVGFEDQSVLYSQYASLCRNQVFPKLMEVGNILERMRIVKSEEELEYLRKAEEIGDMAFAHILKFIKPGMTELEIAAELEAEMKRNGAENLSFDTIVASGPNSSLPHAVPGMRRVQDGDFITMDFGCKYNGYCSDMTRTIVLGKASDKQKEIYNIVLKAQLAALDAVKAGVKGKDIDKVARDIITEAGYGKNFGHGLGHSVGLFIHESPRFSSTEETEILANTIETVEPGIYIPGFGGVRIEDMIIVTEDGHINLAHSPKELIELEIN